MHSINDISFANSILSHGKLGYWIGLIENCAKVGRALLAIVLCTMRIYPQHIFKASSCRNQIQLKHAKNKFDSLNNFALFSVGAHRPSGPSSPLGRCNKAFVSDSASSSPQQTEEYNLNTFSCEYWNNE